MSERKKGGSGMSNAEKQLALDVSDEEARALHRIVRAMHDGHCPRCGHLAKAEDFNVSFLQPGGPKHECPVCELDGETIQVEAYFGRDGIRPHWRSSDGKRSWAVDAFQRWRPINLILPFSELQ